MSNAYKNHSSFTLKRIPAFVSIICANWKELCAEINNCPLLGQEKWDSYCQSEASFAAEKV